jgi:adenosylcobinamide-phosphate synthase
MMTGPCILLGALLMDLLAGEAPNRFHPVAWLGKFISLQLRSAPKEGKVRQFICGMAMVILTVAIITVPLYFLQCHWAGAAAICPSPATGLLRHFVPRNDEIGGEGAIAAAAICPVPLDLQTLSTVVYVLFSIYILKNTFSLRGLWQAVQKVKLSLAAGDLDRARQHSNALVSRRTENLSRDQVISSAIESCSENLCDSFVAPLFYFAVFGLPGAVAYRIVNTFDAMIGFHGQWEYTGKFAARLDDVLNFIPARLSGLFIVTASAIRGADFAGSWRAMFSQHGRTESPNAGWTMGAMAGALGITLEKPGAYSLNGGSRELTLDAITRSQQIVVTAAAIWAVMVAGMEVLIGIAA